MEESALPEPEMGVLLDAVAAVSGSVAAVPQPKAPRGSTQRGTPNTIRRQFMADILSGVGNYFSVGNLIFIRIKSNVAGPKKLNEVTLLPVADSEILHAFRERHDLRPRKSQLERLEVRLSVFRPSHWRLHHDALRQVSQLARLI